MKWNLQSEWVTPPQQERSRRSLEAVLEAAAQLFTRKGFDSTTIQDISVASGVSTGSIYNRFGSKDSILQIIHDSFSTAVISTIFDDALPSECWDRASAADVVLNMLDNIFFIFDQYTDLTCLIEQQRQVNPDVAKRAEKWDDLAIEKAWSILRNKVDQIPTGDPKNTLMTVHYLVRESLAHTMILEKANFRPKFRIGDTAFKASVMRMALRCFGFPDDLTAWKQPTWPRLSHW
jgi:AcrR family transcriptional regulator